MSRVAHHLLIPILNPEQREKIAQSLDRPSLPNALEPRPMQWTVAPTPPFHFTGPSPLSKPDPEFDSLIEGMRWGLAGGEWVLPPEQFPNWWWRQWKGSEAERAYLAEKAAQRALLFPEPRVRGKPYHKRPNKGAGLCRVCDARVWMAEGFTVTTRWTNGRYGLYIFCTSCAKDIPLAKPKKG